MTAQTRDEQDSNRDCPGCPVVSHRTSKGVHLRAKSARCETHAMQATPVPFVSLSRLKRAFLAAQGVGAPAAGLLSLMRATTFAACGSMMKISSPVGVVTRTRRLPASM